MKKNVLPVLAAALIGCCVGLFAGLQSHSGVPAPTPALTATPSPSPTVIPTTACPTDDPLFSDLSPSDSRALLNRAEVVLACIQARDFKALAQYVHPVDGVTFTPYSFVDPEYDVTLTAQEVAGAADDRSERCWGYTDGSGFPIDLTISDYFDQYLYAADYTQAPIISVDYILAYGNAIENVAEAYPDSRFAEFHFPGLDPVQEGLDWCSLKLVFSDYHGEWNLVGCINSQWTI